MRLKRASTHSRSIANWFSIGGYADRPSKGDHPSAPTAEDSNRRPGLATTQRVRRAVATRLLKKFDCPQEPSIRPNQLLPPAFRRLADGRGRDSRGEQGSHNSA